MRVLPAHSVPWRRGASDPSGAARARQGQGERRPPAPHARTTQLNERCPTRATCVARPSMRRRRRRGHRARARLFCRTRARAVTPPATDVRNANSISAGIGGSPAARSWRIARPSMLLITLLAQSLAGSLGSVASPPASVGAHSTCQGEQQPGMCFHSDVSRLNPQGQVYPSASMCCDACASTRSNGTAWPGGTGACLAWVWIEGSSNKPFLVGECHLFSTSVVTRSASTAELNCTSGFINQPAPPQPRPNTTWTVEIGEPELVLDTRGIVANLSAELRRVAHRPQKMGIVVAPEYPWEAWIGFYTSVVGVSPTLYQLYYGCTGPANASVTFLCIAVSSDGISFTKPLNLGMYAYGNSTNNNIVWATPYELLPGRGGTNGGHGGTGWANSIVLDSRPGVPASQRFKMTYDTDTSPFTPRQLLLATSPDGVHWNQLLMASTPDGSLVPTAEFADTNTCLLWVPRLKRYVAFGRIDAGSPGAVCHAGSNFRRVGVLLEGGPQATNDSTPFSNRDFSGRCVSCLLCAPLHWSNCLVKTSMLAGIAAVSPRQCFLMRSAATLGASISTTRLQ